MFSKMLLLLILLQTTQSLQLQYDEDINLVLPAGLIPHSPNDIPNDRYLGQFNNCTCHESPDVLVVCSGEDCRDFPIVPTTAPLFKLQLTMITTIKKDDLRQLGDIEALEIEGNGLLSTIEAGAFKNMSKVKNMTISNNFMLSCLEENVFEGLVNVEIVCLAKNGFRRVLDVAKAFSPKYVPNLVLLDLSQNMFHSIDENEFKNMNGSGLQKLNLNLCGLLYIHPNCLHPLMGLKFLRIGQNLLNKTTITRLINKMADDGIALDLLNLIESGFRKVLPYELLEAVEKANISDVVLARNHFDQIDDDSFPEMSVGTMDLRECYIDAISDGAFKKLHNLSILLLNRNRLNTVLYGVLLPNLTILDLAGNSNDDTYFYIPDRIFENLTVLDDLLLSYNNIQYISNQTFVGLANLTKLNLKNTRLSYIQEGSFSHLSKLLQINLMKNPLLSLTAETFRGLSTVNVTLLGSCGIKNLTATPGLLHYLKNLTFLGLDNNEIQTIDTNQLAHLDQLQKLHLENNRLTSWNKEILPKVEFIEIIVSQNKFNYLTTAMLEDFKYAKSINLDGNPFRCDCSLFPVVQWLKHNKMAVDFSERTNFIAKCEQPENWRKVSIISYLNYLRLNSCDCSTVLSYSQIISIAVLTIFLIITVLILYLFRWYIRYWMFLSKIRFMKYNLTPPDETHVYEYDAFVSYSVEDRAWVSRFCETLEPDLKLCIFERDFPPGSTISHAILQAVTTSKRTILIVTEAFARSHWCRWETQIAQYHQLFFRQDTSKGPDDTLVLIRLEAVKKHATPILRYLMKTRIYLAWPQQAEKQAEFWDKLKVTLSSPKIKT